MQYEVVKFTTIGVLSSINPPYNPHHVPNRRVVGQNIDRLHHCAFYGDTTHAATRLIA